MNAEKNISNGWKIRAGRKSGLRHLVNTLDSSPKKAAAIYCSTSFHCYLNMCKSWLFKSRLNSGLRWVVKHPTLMVDLQFFLENHPATAFPTETFSLIKLYCCLMRKTRSRRISVLQFSNSLRKNAGWDRCGNKRPQWSPILLLYSMVEKYKMYY